MAKEIRFIERFKAQASHAAQVQSRVKKLDKIEAGAATPAQNPDLRVPAGSALGRGRGQACGREQGLRNASDLPRPRPHDRRGERSAVIGVNGAGKSSCSSWWRRNRA